MYIFKILFRKTILAEPILPNVLFSFFNMEKAVINEIEKVIIKKFKVSYL